MTYHHEYLSAMTSIRCRLHHLGCGLGFCCLCHCCLLVVFFCVLFADFGTILWPTRKEWKKEDQTLVSDYYCCYEWMRSVQYLKYKWIHGFLTRKWTNQHLIINILVNMYQICSSFLVNRTKYWSSSFYFYNHNHLLLLCWWWILTWVSVSCSCLANAFRSDPTTYWLPSNAFSNSSNCNGANAVRIRFGFRYGCNRKSPVRANEKDKRN